MDSGWSGTRNFSYDSRGNVITAGQLQFTYDRSEQPVAIAGTANGIGSASGSYRYDGHFKRVKQQVNGRTIYSVYDRAGALVHLDAATAGEQTDYIAGPQGTLARIKNNVVTYLHHDILGSAQSGTNSSGVVQWRKQYSPFGEELQGISANTDQAGYTGHVRDAATGLSYMQARYYDPVIGRFYSNDPVDMLGHMQRGNSPANGFNRYAYANNNPYKYVDPDGKLPIVPVLVAGGRACASNAACRGALVSGARATARGAKKAYNAIVGVFSESSEDVTDRSGQEGTTEEMDDFEAELDSISSPERNGKTTVRNLNPGVSADDLLDKAPGTGRDDGRKDTAEGGNTGTHSSTKTKGNPKTLDVNRPNQRPKKYREQK